MLFRLLERSFLGASTSLRTKCVLVIPMPLVRQYPFSRNLPSKFSTSPAVNTCICRLPSSQTTTPRSCHWDRWERPNQLRGSLELDFDVYDSEEHLLILIPQAGGGLTVPGCRLNPVVAELSFVGGGRVEFGCPQRSGWLC